VNELPSGTVTFLFTDIEGSTRLLEQDPTALKSALRRHNELVGAAIAAHQGFVFETVGDAFYAAFLQAGDAVAAAIDVQVALLEEKWDERAPIRARLALHTGDVELQGRKYFGAALFRVARLLSAAHGGQIVLSTTTANLVQDGLPEPARLQDLGEHRLRDLTRPERIWQLIHPRLDARFPPLRSLSTLPNNLPLPMTSFIGRDRELAETRRLLGTTRLVTFTGTGGAGKTRLATQLGAELLHDYANGVWFIDLAPLTDPNQVAPTILLALGIQAQASQSAVSALLTQLEPRQLLLILDNCEHLVEECARVADALLRGCPNVRILATSREVLGVAGEVSWRIPSLPVPSDRESVSGEQAIKFEAVRLFVDRAMAVSPSFALSDHNALAVAQIARRLDGIPLAIELAASRVRVLSVEQISARLDDCFRLLTGGNRLALPRQQTFRALIDWSYDLLPEPERIVLGRLATFSGSFDLEAAEAVCSGPAISAMDVLDLLIQLVEKSLVLAEGSDDEARYRLLESIRRYGTEKLIANGEQVESQRRHAAYYVDFAEAAEPRLPTSERARWLKRLDGDYDNVRAVLTSSGDGIDRDTGLRLVGALTWYWLFRGRLADGSTWFARLLDGGPADRTPALGKALAGAATLDGLQGQGDLAHARLEQSVAVCREVGDRRGLARALVLLSAFAETSAEAPGHASAIDEGMALFRAIGNEADLALTLRLSGVLAFHRGDHPVARARQEAALALYRDLGDRWFTAQTLNSLGDIARTEGDTARATVLYQEALALSREARLGGMVPSLLQNLAHLACRGGDTAGAGRLYKEGLALFRDQGDSRGVAECLGGLAGVCASTLQLETAACLFGATEDLLLATGAVMWPHNRVDYDNDRADVQSRLGEEAFVRSWSAGQAMSQEQAIAYALSADLGL
jgi:predicted ATPase/class 3 adenylate cyclase